MDIGAISVGPDPPKDIYAVIEIPLGGAPVKYELDKASGALMVDRFLHTAMFYPGNYGFIPRTLSADGDPCDVLVVTQVQVVPGAIVRCRPVGALLMEDEAGRDEKIIAVPVDALAPFYADIRNYRDLPSIMCEQIAHFSTPRPCPPMCGNLSVRWTDQHPGGRARRCPISNAATSSRCSAARPRGHSRRARSSRRCR